MATRLTTQRRTSTRHVLSVSGIEAVIAELGRVSDAVVDEVEHALEEAAQIVRDDASRRAPRETGFLSRNIEYDIDREGHHRVSARVGPNKRAWYGIFPEVGTRHQAAQPYLRPALDSRRKEVEATIIDNLKRAIERAI